MFDYLFLVKREIKTFSNSNYEANIDVIAKQDNVRMRKENYIHGYRCEKFQIKYWQSDSAVCKKKKKMALLHLKHSGK